MGIEEFRDLCVKVVIEVHWLDETVLIKIKRGVIAEIIEYHQRRMRSS